MKKILLGVLVVVIVSGTVGYRDRWFGSALVGWAGNAKAPAEDAAGVTSGEGSSSHSSAVEISGRELIYPEVAAEAASLGRDVKRILSFVSNDISYEPYDGALRGSRGTLLAKAGDATDKALLLRDLVRLAEPTSDLRFALCTLPSQEARQMISATLSRLPAPPAVPQEEDRISRSGRRKAANEKVADEQHRRAVANHLSARWRSLADELQQESAVLETTLRQAGVTVDSAPTPRTQLEKRAQRHVWLQYRQESSWIDLDPTIAGAVPGQRRCSVEHTVRALPENLYHHLSISVVLVKRQGARLSTRSLLQARWRTADLVGSTITYAHAEPLGLGELVPKSPPSSEGARYTPLLILDEELRLGKSFVLPRPASSDAPGEKGLGAGIGQLGGGIGQMLGGGHVGQVPGRAASDQQLGNAQQAAGAEVTSLWLRFVVAPPSGPSETIERPIFDRVGYVARAAGDEARAPLAPIESARGDYAPLQTIWSIAMWTGEAKMPLSLYPALVGRRKATSVTGLHSVLENLGMLHRSFYALRQVLFRTAGPLGGENLIVSSVNLSLLSWAVRPRDAVVPGGALAFDLLDNRVSYAPGPGSGTPAWIRWGQASLQAERLLFLGPRALTGAGENPKDRKLLADVSSVFAQARQEQIKFLLLGPGDAPKIEKLTASDEARARLRSRLGEGLTVLVPERAVRMPDRSAIGWWLIDSKTGFLLDEMEDGRHQAGVESPLVTKETKEETAAEEAAWQRKWKKAVICLGVTAEFLISYGAAAYQYEHGHIEAGNQAVDENLSDFEGVLEECEEEEAPPSPPGRMATGPRPPPSSVGRLPDGRIFFNDAPLAPHFPPVVPGIVK
jgi:hypothetical protein